MSSSFNVLFAVAEASPLINVGELGFVCVNCDVGELLTALRQALTAFQKKEEQHRLMRRVMHGFLVKVICFRVCIPVSDGTT